MLQIDSEIMKESKDILQKTLDEITWKPDAVIGIHVRSSREYLNHLKLLELLSFKIRQNNFPHLVLMMNRYLTRQFS